MLKSLRVLVLDYLALGSTGCGLLDKCLDFSDPECFSSTKWRHNQFLIKGDNALDVHGRGLGL